MTGDTSILRHHLEPLARALDDPTVREVVVNRPGEFGVERADGWTWTCDPRLSTAWLVTLARAAAAHGGQDVDASAPLCATSLPDGARCQIVLPPTSAHVSLTIRRPMGRAPSMADLSAGGLFAMVGTAEGAVDLQTRRLSALRAAGDWPGFLRAAVQNKQTILVSGATGSGKTSLARALIGLIPANERLVTIEDARELNATHRNLVSLTWARGGQGRASLGPGDLLTAALRMRPDRILLGEIRDGPSAFHLLRNIASGHPGSVATLHAGSCDLALDQLTLMVRETEAGRDLPRGEVRELFERLIDIVIQVERQGADFRIREVRHGSGLAASRVA